MITSNFHLGWARFLTTFNPVAPQCHSLVFLCLKCLPSVPLQKSALESPATPAAPATAPDAVVTAAGNDWLSLAKQQGASPLIIVLQHPGAGTPVLG